MISLGAGHHPCPPSLWPKRYSCPTFHVNRSVIHHKHTYICVYMYYFQSLLALLQSKKKLIPPQLSPSSSFLIHPSVHTRKPWKVASEHGFYGTTRLQSPFFCFKRAQFPTLACWMRVGEREVTAPRTHARQAETGQANCNP